MTKTDGTQSTALKSPGHGRTLTVLFLTAVIIWTIVGFGTFFLVALLRGTFPVVDYGKSGTFGDTFGLVNSLFSSLGVAGVAYALYLQIQEQNNSRIESDQSKDHSAKLTLLAALVHARSAQLQTAQSRLSHVQFITFLASEDKKEEFHSISLGLSKVERQISKELDYLTYHAELQSGWYKQKHNVIKFFKDVQDIMNSTDATEPPDHESFEINE